MSESKTVIPGQNQSLSSSSSLYSRLNTVPDSKRGRTVVPGRDISAVGSEEGGIEKKKNNSSSDAPIVGFLYSISRQGIGEYWPLHVGRNTIGRSADNDIQLKETSVSDHHASLNIKQMKSTQKILASIRDEGSSNGIFVNDEELDYSVHEVKNLDKILIGENYTLLLLLIDCVAFGLEVASNFHSSEDGDPSSLDNKMESLTSNLYSSDYRPDGGTVSMDGSNPDYGKTQIF